MSKDRIQLSDHFTTGRLLRFVASPIIMMIFTSVYRCTAWWMAFLSRILPVKRHFLL